MHRNDIGTAGPTSPHPQIEAVTVLSMVHRLCVLYTHHCKTLAGGPSTPDHATRETREGHRRLFSARAGARAAAPRPHDLGRSVPPPPLRPLARPRPSQKSGAAAAPSPALSPGPRRRRRSAPSAGGGHAVAGAPAGVSPAGRGAVLSCRGGLRGRDGPRAPALALGRRHPSSGGGGTPGPRRRRRRRPAATRKVVKDGAAGEHERRVTGSEAARLLLDPRRRRRWSPRPVSRPCLFVAGARTHGRAAGTGRRSRGRGAQRALSCLHSAAREKRRPRPGAIGSRSSTREEE